MSSPGCHVRLPCVSLLTADVQQLVSTVGRWAARGALTLAGVTFFIQWLLPRLRKWYRQHVLQEKPPDPAANPPGIYIYIGGLTQF